MSRDAYAVPVPLSRRARSSAAVALAAYALFVALVAFWPIPVDRPLQQPLFRLLGAFSGIGIRPIDAYTVLESAGNVLFFVPPGLLFVLIVGRRRWWLAPLVGFAASAVIEAGQFAFLPERFASLMDVAANTTGALLGAALGVVVCARRERRGALAEAGSRVLLLEAFGRGHDRGSSHGATRIFRHGYAEADYVGMTVAARDGWRKLERASGRALLEETGAVDHGDPAALDRIQDAMAAAGIGTERLDGTEAHRRWPGLLFEEDVLFHADGGRLHADAAIEALLDAAAVAGAELRFGAPVAQVRPVGSGAVSVLVGHDVLRASCLVRRGGFVDAEARRRLARGARPPAAGGARDGGAAGPFPACPGPGLGRERLAELRASSRLGRPGRLRSADARRGSEGRHPRQRSGRRPGSA